jgi:outer membrane lipoprotein-sorting protein
MARALRSRSIVAAGVAAVAVVVAVALTTAGAATRPDLKPVAPDRLIASSITAAADRSLSMSGTVETHVDLGIPQLPGSLSAGPAGAGSVLTSDQTFRVWRSPDGIRVAQMLPAAERDLVVTPTDAWLWDSQRFAAWHATLPGASAIPDVPSLGDAQTMISNLLSRLAPFADVTTADPVEVAGRPAYVVRLTPAPSSNTLVDRVEVAIDAQTRVPLRLQAFATGADAPAIDAGYTDVSFGPVDASMFRFNAPDGAALHRVRPPAEHRMAGDLKPFEMPQVRWFGTGFDVVAAIPVSSMPKELAPLFPYRGPLGSADVVEGNDGHTWLVAGLVPPDALAQAESRLP